MSRQGKQVGDAFIDVHGDLSKFRKDLEGAGADIQKLARQQAETFTDEFNKRLKNDIGRQWGSVVDAIHQAGPIDVNRLIGDFNATGLDDAQEKINKFLLDMSRHQKLTGDNYKQTKEALNGAIDSMRAYEQAQAKLQGQEKAWQSAHLDMMDALKQARQDEADAATKLHTDALAENTAWADRRKKTMEEAIAMNERYNRSFDGMIKTVQRGNLSRDFQSMADAMANADFAKFAKGFDSFPELRRRVSEVTAAMVEQGRMTRENAAAASSATHQYILEEEAKLKATQDALDAARNAREEQDRYNKSLSGMLEASKVRQLETDFRNLADAMNSGDWEKITRGSKDIDATSERLRQMATSMALAGRITVDQHQQILTSLRSMSAEYKAAADAASKLKNEAQKTGNAFETLHAAGTRFHDLLGRMSVATKGLREHLGGFAGANVFGDMIERGFNFIHNLDRIALSVAQVTLKLGSMAAIGGSGLAGLTVLVADMVDSVGGLGLLLPAFATGLGLMLFTTASALASLKKKFKTVFAEIKQDMGDAMFTAMDPAMDRFNNTLLPTLKTNLAKTAASMGLLYGSIFDGITNSVTPEQMNTMFSRLNGAIEKSRVGTQALVHAWAVLGMTGSAYFDRVAGAVNKLGTQFDHFITTAANNGDLDKWIERGITGFKDMGRALDGVFGIFNAVESAARAAGSGGLKSFADSMQGMAETMQSRTFQTALTQLFEGMNSATGAIGRAIGGLGPALASIMPFIKQSFADIGSAVATVIGYVGQILEDPKIHLALINFTGSIDKAIRDLAPAVDPFASSLAHAADLLGKILENIAPIATAFAVQISPILDTLSEKLGTLIEPLKNSMLGVIDAVAPVLASIDKNLAGPLIGIFRDTLLPAIDRFVKDAAPQITTIIDTLGPLFTATVGSIAETLGKILGAVDKALPAIQKFIDKIGPPLLDAIKAASDAVGTFADGFGKAFEKIDKGDGGGGLLEALGGIFAGVGGFLAKAWQVQVDRFATGNDFGTQNRKFWDWFGKRFVDDFNLTNDWANELNGKVNGWLNGLWDGVSSDGGLNDTVNTWFDDNVFKPIREGWDSAFKAIGEWWTGVKSEFQKWMNGLLGFGDHDNSRSGTGGSVGGRGMGVGAKILPAILDEEGEKSWLDTFNTNINTKLAEFWTGLGENLTSFGEGIKVGWDEFWTGLSTTVSEIWDGIALWISTKYTEISTGITTWAAQVGTNWGVFWDGVNTKVTDIWNTVTNWISVKAGEIRTNIDGFINGVRTNWDNFWNGVNQTVTNVWNQVTGWISGKVAEIQGNISGFIGTVTGNWNSFWDGVGQKVSDAWNGITQGIQNGITNAVNFVGELPGKAVAAIGEMGGLLLQKGIDFAQGFINGIGSMVRDIANAAANFVGAAIEAARGAQDSNSPSKVTAGLGQDFGDGFTLGIDKTAGKAVDAAAAMVDAAVGSVTTGFAKSKMYLAGAEAALGLADGLKDNASVIDGALSGIIPSGQISIGAAGGVGAPTPGNTTIVNVAAGAIPVTTPTKDPELVASKVIDGFAGFSNF